MKRFNLFHGTRTKDFNPSFEGHKVLYLTDSLDMAYRFATANDCGGLTKEESAHIFEVGIKCNSPRIVNEDEWEEIADICNIDKEGLIRDGFDCVMCTNSSNCTYVAVLIPNIIEFIVETHTSLDTVSVQCLECGKTFNINREEVEIDELGTYYYCDECDSSFDIVLPEKIDRIHDLRFLKTPIKTTIIVGVQHLYDIYPYAAELITEELKISSLEYNKEWDIKLFCSSDVYRLRVHVELERNVTVVVKTIEGIQYYILDNIIQDSEYKCKVVKLLRKYIDYRKAFNEVYANRSYLFERYENAILELNNMEFLYNLN